MKNIAVIGSGYWGKNLIRNFHELGSLKYIYDVSTESRTELQELYGLNDCSFEDILDDKKVDGVVIATPASTHYDIAKECLENNKDIFVEKPICLSLKDAQKLKIQAKKKNKIIMVGHLLNYHNHFQALLEIIKKNNFGDLIRVRSTRKSFGKLRENENVIWSFGTHDISMINRFTEGPVLNLQVSKNMYFNNNVDCALITFKKSNVNVEIDLDWSSVSKLHRLELYFEKNILVFEDSSPNNENKLYYYENSAFNKTVLTEKNNFLKKYVLVEESQPLKNECQHFLKCICSRKTPITDIDESIEVLKVLLMTDEK